MSIVEGQRGIMVNYNILLTKDETVFLINLLSWLTNKATDEKNKKISQQILMKLNSKLHYKKHEEFNYLSGLSETAKGFFFEVLNNHDFNLYHSVAAIIKTNGKRRSLEETFEYYYKKYKEKRPYIMGKEIELKEIIEFVDKRLNKNKS